MEKNMINEEFFTSKPIKGIVFVVLVLFSILTGNALWQQGFIGIFEEAMKSPGSMQIFVDLFIALCFALGWVWYDTKKTNRSFLPWLIITLIAGSYGPLLYLLFRKPSKDKSL